MATITPKTNSSRALLPAGWPLTQVAASGMLGNNATHETVAAVDKSTTAAKKFTTALSQSGNTASRIL